MIQRIQTIYLIAIIILIAMMCNGSLISIQNINENGTIDTYNLNVFYFNTLVNNVANSQIQYGLIAIAGSVIAFTLFIIFSFKDRQKQKKLVKINFLFMLMLISALFSKAVMDIPSFSFGKMLPYSTFGVMMMLFIFYLNWRTLMLIKRDEEMLKSADRLRD